MLRRKPSICAVKSTLPIFWKFYISKVTARRKPTNQLRRNMEMESDIENMTMSEYLKDIFDMWDITIEDVERVRQFLTPNIPDVIDNIQPLILITIHTTPPDEDYVAPATKSILDDILEEFGDEILNVTMVDKRVDAHGVVLGSSFAIGRHFKFGLVRYHAKDDDGIFVKQTWSMA
ncbi:hypothetical protein Tco_0577023 [Tanacetum coccineum]